ncbi:MAG TPA: ubiquinone/menaquinone biosynthesis methyltransferase [Verrucomicrobiae bacterium]|nr:ubiquinone/menaquinone biosynthesis methyltransferase [Verrucomicrobiae bacterium]
MANKFYAPGEQRAARVNALFDTIAGRYDLVNDLQSFGLHRYWKRRLVRLAVNSSRCGTAANRSTDEKFPQRTQQALDLCCGTGDVAFALARSGMDVAGLDFSEPMLAVAGQRIRRACDATGTGVHAVRLLRGDAQRIPFPDEIFDLVTISYGLRNLASLETGLREMRRVLRPSGRAIILDFGKPENRLWRAIYFGYLQGFVPLLGRLFCGDADTHGYILESLKGYAAQKGVADKMRELNFEEVSIVNLMGGIMSINYGQRPA